MSDVVSKFMQPMLRQFRISEAYPAWEADYIRILGPYSGEILERAAQLMMASRTKPTFPLPSECNRACLDAMDMLALEDRRRTDDTVATSKRNGRKDYPEWSDARRKLADKLLNCDIGRQAVQEEWGWGLWDWLREKERFPDAHELAKLRLDGMEESRKFREAYLDQDRIDPKTINPAISKLIKMRENVYNRLKSVVGL